MYWALNGERSEKLDAHRPEASSPTYRVPFNLSHVHLRRVKRHRKDTARHPFRLKLTILGHHLCQFYDSLLPNHPQNGYVYPTERRLQLPFKTLSTHKSHAHFEVGARDEFLV